MRFTRAVLNEAGADHRIVVLDGRWVFRFPRGAEREALFRSELAVLARLDGRARVPVPRYRFVSRARDFGGYAFIEGRELSPALFAALPRATQHAVLDDIAELLRAVHTLPASCLEGPARAAAWTGADYTRRYRQERRGLIARAVEPALLARIDAFFEAFAAQPGAPRQVVIHGDLTDDHMLLAPGGEALAGVIDFGDVEAGDPAHDLAFFWAYGDWAAEYVSARLEICDDPGSLGRSLWQFARFRIDQLRWPALEVHKADTQAIAAELPALLIRLKA